MYTFSCRGDLLIWDILATGQQKWQPFTISDKKQQHNRIIFNLKLGCHDNNLMATTSMDRQVSTCTGYKKKSLRIKNQNIQNLLS